MDTVSGRAPAGQAGHATHEAASASSPSGDHPSRDWQRLYNGLLSMRPDGKFADQEIAVDLILTGFVESREVKKPCRNCGTSLFDYRFNRITAAGRMFMEASAIAIEARSGETGTGSTEGKSAAIAQGDPA